MDNQKQTISELTLDQMEKVSGGVQSPNSQPKGFGLDCFRCPGYIINTEHTQICGYRLRQVPGKVNVYRCDNGNCELCGKDQHPMG